MKKKIIFVITKSNWGGAQRYVFDLITSIPSREFEKKILFGKSDEEGSLDKRIRAISTKEKIAYEYLPHLERDIDVIKEIRSFFALYRIFKKERPDIVHLNSSKAGGLGALAARLAGVKKIIFTAHGWPVHEDRPELEKTFVWFVSWVTLLVSHTTITLHERDYHSFDAWPFTKGKAVKIHNGVRDEVKLPRKEARAALFKECRVPEHGYLVGTVAELHKNKGLLYLIEALPLLPETTLCIIGSGEERPNLESRVKELGLIKRVFFTGFHADATKLMSGFDVFVLPSLKEGFPFVLLEAGAREVPIVATAVGGIPEIVHTGNTGLLVAPKEPEELAQAIRLLMKDESIGKQYASALAHKIRQEFQFDTVTLPQTLALYRS